MMYYVFHGGMSIVIITDCVTEIMNYFKSKGR